MKKKITTSRNPKELAKHLGLTDADALGWKLRAAFTKKIVQVFHNSKMTITELAKKSGTSRARITLILKDETMGISLDVLVKVLSSLGQDAEIRFSKSA